MADMRKSVDPTAVIRPYSPGDLRRRRKVIGEDFQWNLALVPPLTQLCLQHIVTHFEEKPIYHELLPIHQTYVLHRLPASLPLQVTAHLISDESYWERCCKQRWHICDTSLYGDSWKRMFFERHLENAIEFFIPDVTDLKAVLDLLPLCGEYVRQLKISQLLPNVKDVQDDDDEEENEASFRSVQRPDHFDFSLLLDKLAHLEELQVVYEVKNCGMNFEWCLFEFSLRDCKALAKAVKSCKTLKVFRLIRSKVDDAKCRVLINGLLNHPSLIELDFSHNVIGDEGAKDISKLLGKSKLQRLCVYNNSIGAAGGKDISQALETNYSLLHLNLRLNRLGDEGGRAIAQALLTNDSLQSLHLGANEMTEAAAMAFAKVFARNKTLTHINLSCNKLGEDGGRQLEKGISDNSSLVECDIRLTEVGQESESCIRNVLHNNQMQARRKPHRE